MILYKLRQVYGGTTKLQERDDLIKPLFSTRLQVLLERFGVLVLIFFRLLPNLAGIWNEY